MKWCKSLLINQHLLIPHLILIKHSVLLCCSRVINALFGRKKTSWRGWIGKRTLSSLLSWQKQITCSGLLWRQQMRQHSVLGCIKLMTVLSRARTVSPALVFNTSALNLFLKFYLAYYSFKFVNTLLWNQLQITQMSLSNNSKVMK